MITQLNEIRTTLQAIQKMDIPEFSDLSKTAQTVLVYDMAKMAISSNTFWTNALEESNNPSPETMMHPLYRPATAASIARQEQGIAESALVTKSMCSYLEYLAGIEEADSKMITIDKAYQDSFDKAAADMFIKDDIVVSELAAMHSRPYAWAKNNLETTFTWPKDTVAADKIVIPLEGYSRVLSNHTAQLFGRWLYQISQDIQLGQRSDARDLEIASAYAPLRDINTKGTSQAFVKALYGILYGQKGKFFMDNKEQILFSDLYKRYPQVKEAVQDEEQESEIRAKSREIKTKIRVKSFQASTFEQLKEQVILLRAKHAETRDIEDLLEQFEDDLTSRQYKDLINIKSVKE